MTSIRNCLFVSLVLLAGCNDPPPTDFDLASRAIHDNNTNELAVIIARNRGVVTNAARWDGGTLLHLALGGGSYVSDSAIDCAKLLVAAGANVKRADITGKTPLHLVCSHGAPSNAVAFLLEHGAEVNARNTRTPQGETPLGSLRKWSKTPGFVDQAGLDRLISHGAME